MCWAYHNPLESFKSVRRKATQDGRKAHPSLVSSSPNFQSQSSNEKCHSNPVEEGATKRLSRNFKSVKVMKDKERQEMSQVTEDLTWGDKSSKKLGKFEYSLYRCFFLCFDQCPLAG
jgi:hypothetical protein